MIALSVAALLAVFLLYTSIAGGGTLALQPSQLKAHEGEKVALEGTVVARGSGNARGEGLRFRVRDRDGGASVLVLYRGSVPDLFDRRRDVFLRGRLQNGVFVAERDSLMTKCPSKYSPSRQAEKG